MPFKSLVNSAIIFRAGASLTIAMHLRRPLFSSRQKDAPCRYIGGTTTSVGITTRGGFIIPANDLTKRTRRPGMGRVESRSPSFSRSTVVSLAVASLFPERSYSPIYIPRCNLRWPRRAVRASIYAINHSKRPSTAAIGDTAIYRASGVQLPFEKREKSTQSLESRIQKLF